MQRLFYITVGIQVALLGVVILGSAGGHAAQLHWTIKLGATILSIVLLGVGIGLCLTTLLSQ